MKDMSIFLFIKSAQFDRIRSVVFIFGQLKLIVINSELSTFLLRLPCAKSLNTDLWGNKSSFSCL